MEEFADTLDIDLLMIESILGIGIDIADIKRFERARHLQRVAEYILTPAEVEVMNTRPDPIQYLASRFAVKEAVIKALPFEIGYRDIEIRKNGRKPTAHLLKELEIPICIDISLSHSPEFAAGTAIAYQTI